MDAKQARQEIERWSKRVSEHKATLAFARDSKQCALDFWARLVSPIVKGQIVYRKFGHKVDVWKVSHVGGKDCNFDDPKIVLTVGNVKADGSLGLRHMHLYPYCEGGVNMRSLTALVDDPRKGAKWLSAETVVRARFGGKR